MPHRRVLSPLTVALLCGALLAGTTPISSASPARLTGVPQAVIPAAPVPPAAPATAPRGNVRASDLRVTELFVRTGVDTDRDGRRDVVRVAVTRPPARLVDRRRLALVVHASPYWSCCGEAPNHDVDVPLGGPRPAITSGFRHGLRAEGLAWARRGYAFARVASLGTDGSTGCPTIGTRAEASGATAVVDWANGRTSARTAPGAAGRRVRAGWATGSVGMVGVSYDGTLPNMAAATGVRGLDAIVPISAISSWYGYYRQDGLVVAPGGYQGEDTDVLARFDYTRADQQVCAPVIRRLERRQDRRTGDHSHFWAARDLLDKADRVRAAVLVAHGFGDTNVKPDQAARWYAALRRAGVETKVWWDQGDHGTPIPQRLVTRWFDHYLYGVSNGIARGPRAAVSTAAGRTTWYADWPRPGASPQPWSLRGPGRLVRGGRSRGGAVGFTDDPSLSAADACERPAAATGYAAPFTTRRLPRGLGLSGTPSARLRLAFDRAAANVTVALCAAHGDRGRLLTQGFADPQNRSSLSRGTALVPGRRYTVRVRLQPLDQRLRKGTRLRLLVMASDHDFTLRPPAGTQVRLWPADSALLLPTVR